MRLPLQTPRARRRRLCVPGALTGALMGALGERAAGGGGPGAVLSCFICGGGGGGGRGGPGAALLPVPAAAGAGARRAGAVPCRRLRAGVRRGPLLPGRAVGGLRARPHAGGPARVLAQAAPPVRRGRRGPLKWNVTYALGAAAGDSDDHQRSESSAAADEARGSELSELSDTDHFSEPEPTACNAASPFQDGEPPPRTTLGTSRRGDHDQ